MPRAPKIIPISHLRQNAGNVIKGVSSSREPVFITQRGKAAAVSFCAKAAKTLSRLGKFPESWRLLPEFPNLPFREVIVRLYRLFYRIKNKTVWIVAVWHGA